MSIQNIVWAFGLRGLSPLARLMAIRMADRALMDGVYRIDCRDLGEWCEADPDEVVRELTRLLIVSGLHSVGKTLPEFVKLPGGTPDAPNIPRPPDMSPMWIYVARSPDRTKIGVTRDRRARMETLACASGQIVDLVWSCKLAAHVAREVERQVLAKFAPHRIIGEWFRIDPAVAIAEIERRIADPGPVASAAK